MNRSLAQRLQALEDQAGQHEDKFPSIIILRTMVGVGGPVPIKGIKWTYQGQEHFAEGDREEAHAKLDQWKAEHKPVGALLAVEVTA